MSVADLMENDLDSIISKEHNMYSRLKDLETFLFGPCDGESSGPEVTEPITWEERMKFKLGRVSEIQQKQMDTFDKISRFHQ